MAPLLSRRRRGAVTGLRTGSAVPGRAPRGAGPVAARVRMSLAPAPNATSEPRGADLRLWPRTIAARARPVARSGVRSLGGNATWCYANIVSTKARTTENPKLLPAAHGLRG